MVEHYSLALDTVFFFFYLHHHVVSFPPLHSDPHLPKILLTFLNPSLPFPNIFQFLKSDAYILQLLCI